MIWANLIHLSYNMWLDREPIEDENPTEHIVAKPYLRFDDSLWRDMLAKMSEVGMNMVILDLGDAVQYRSHPEIAVENAWSPGRLREELTRARGPRPRTHPKTQLLACHDVWLGPYSRCLSTDAYYKVVKDLIAETIDLFDGPRFFHLGMDEETANHQRFHEYVVIRQYDLWWRDFLLMVDAVEAGNSRAWIWSDYVWNHPELFYEKMPKSVLQSNWYYGEFEESDMNYIQAYQGLEDHGYDQVPTGSNWSHDTNFERTVDHCRGIIAPERLAGFMQAPWKPTLEVCRDHHMRAIEQVGRAIQAAQ